VLVDPSACPEQEMCRLRDQVVNNLERAWEITGSGDDELTSMMLQINQVVAKEFGRKG
jgi:hypothetical protein